MSDLKSIIKDIVAGNSFKVIREIRNIPVGDSLSRAFFTVKNRREDSDDIAIFQKDVTASENDDGQIVDNGARDKIALVSIKLKPQDTIKLKQNQPYWFDLKLLTAAGAQYTPELGQIIVTDPVTYAGIGSDSLVISSGSLSVDGEESDFSIGIIF